jgi:hypothetical protein
MLSGCAARPIHPGTANTFDSKVYDTMLTTDQVIKSTKTELANNSFSATLASQVKAALNILITVYNDADTLYCNPPANAGPTDSCAAGSYHMLALAGQTTPAADAAMQAKLTTVDSATQSLITAKGTK